MTRRGSKPSAWPRFWKPVEDEPPRDERQHSGQSTSSPSCSQANTSTANNFSFGRRQQSVRPAIGIHCETKVSALSGLTLKRQLSPISTVSANLRTVHGPAQFQDGDLLKVAIRAWPKFGGDHYLVIKFWEVNVGKVRGFPTLWLKQNCRSGPDLPEDHL